MEKEFKMDEDLYNDLLEKHGSEYLLLTNCVDEDLIPMDEFNATFCDDSPVKIANYMLNADRYNPNFTGSIESKAFNLNDDYFYFDGYGYPVSVPYEYASDYYKSQIDKNDFIDWLDSNSYIDDLD